MESMYDKLGDLLSQALDKGYVPESSKNSSKENNFSHNQKDSDKNSHDSESIGASSVKTQKESKDIVEEAKVKSDSQRNFTEPMQFNRITPELTQAFHFFEISFSASFDDLKKVYKEKLKYYHPDKNSKNPVFQKVATDKTRQVIEYYNYICSMIINK